MYFKILLLVAFVAFQSEANVLSFDPPVADVRSSYGASIQEQTNVVTTLARAVSLNPTTYSALLKSWAELTAFDIPGTFVTCVGCTEVVAPTASFSVELYDSANAITLRIFGNKGD